MKGADAAPRRWSSIGCSSPTSATVDGVPLPHHIARGTGEKTTEEWEIKSYKVNPTIKADRFKVGNGTVMSSADSFHRGSVAAGAHPRSAALAATTARAAARRDARCGWSFRIPAAR